MLSMVYLMIVLKITSKSKDADMYKQYLDAMHMIDDMFGMPMKEDDAKIVKPYIQRWYDKLKDVTYDPTPFESVLGISESELELPLDLPDAPVSELGDGDIDFSDVL